MSQLGKGDIESARASFRTAADELSRADAVLNRPWTQPARLVPVLAQNRNAVVDLADGASSAASTIADVLDTIDLDSLRVVRGRIDIDAIRALEQPLVRLNETLDALNSNIRDADTQWLAGPLRRRLLGIADDVGKR